MFFFEKKNQKTFIRLAPVFPRGDRAQSHKSLFASFSSEKEESSLTYMHPRCCSEPLRLCALDLGGDQSACTGDSVTIFPFPQDADYLWHDSSEADEHIAVFGIGSEPVCWLQIGYASGYARAGLDLQRGNS